MAHSAVFLQDILEVYITCIHVHEHIQFLVASFNICNMEFYHIDLLLI